MATSRLWLAALELGSEWEGCVSGFRKWKGELIRIQPRPLHSPLCPFIVLVGLNLLIVQVSPEERFCEGRLYSMGTSPGRWSTDLQTTNTGGWWLTVDDICCWGWTRNVAVHCHSLDWLWPKAPPTLSQWLGECRWLFPVNDKAVELGCSVSSLIPAIIQRQNPLSVWARSKEKGITIATAQMLSQLMQRWRWLQVTLHTSLPVLKDW